MDRFLSDQMVLPGPITLADLPPRDTVRWVSRRKAAVVAAVQAGVISLPDACARYALSVEEFLSWQRTVERHGVPGLRITHAQDYRQPGRER
ncbi:DUF1153 domain-containing protein [Rhizomicrobium electricum]|uniref:CtrA inhibitor SciP n=1 Tax=Rhizomicrobium electricum TaxID=480070 RepID=A0ABP3P1A6_9PROT|nr:DUF1153 domain-containing protein [Rhizomicrobium electricum]NIJ47516.1 hypothetical protein [Rhizomicrobium electricum]